MDESPCVQLRGKGRKQRTTPLWKNTVQEIQTWLTLLPIHRSLHALCNAQHQRELEWAYEQNNQQWAKDMQALLQDILEEVKAQSSSLSAEQARHYTEYYRNLLNQAESECLIIHYKPTIKRSQSLQNPNAEYHRQMHLIFRLTAVPAG